MKSKDKKFFDMQIQAMLDNEISIEKKIYKENKYEQYTNVQLRVMAMIEDDLRESRENNQLFKKRQDKIVIILQSLACIMSFLIVGTFCDSLTCAYLFAIVGTLFGLTLIIFNINRKYERRNN